MKEGKRYFFLNYSDKTNGQSFIGLGTKHNASVPKKRRMAEFGLKHYNTIFIDISKYFH